ncbi:TetR/AcrR family transcriptional regulator [Mesorhizobium sp. BR1-1-16]|uniref:TetR/AcrR family transcriptional regulator n=1 Tax=Mesorhizobium sp. BR1-1-16 TaxID=2876653 RepID=UPI001CCADD79|nr:TetR/AcrR family transcriptional regulator [Mesorhizobium sp. BR1-1-16]MBZ9939384.1 TetR/AcrR family transcriptional regulator [Mesorhizobium sp. BR1-1-16]
MKERAKARDETRERILAATMQLHDEQGVAATSFVDIAKRAGIGAATVYRHFETPGALVRACGEHVWAEMRPPQKDHAPELFDSIRGRDARLRRLAEELDRFYARGALRLERATADRDHVPELDQFLGAVEAGVASWVDYAVKDTEEPGGPSTTPIRRLLALTSFGVWLSMLRAGLGPEERVDLLARVLACAMRP